MFIRVKSSPNSPRKSVQIVESVRDGDKVRQKILRHVGVANDKDELDRLLELAEFIKAKIENERHPTLFSTEILAKVAIQGKKINSTEDSLVVDLKKLREQQRVITGIHEAYGKIYQELQFDQLVKSDAKSKMLEHIVMARIANPSSKRASVQMLERDFGIELDLHKVYRMMDSMDDDFVTNLQSMSYHAANQIFGGKIDVIFFDATTLYFESFTEDDLKKNGYSKDGKFNQPQVLLALMVTKEGLPIGYEAFPGSMYEGHTLLPMLEKIRQKYNLEKVVFVADSGLLNEENLALLEDSGFEYIVGARLKNLKKALKTDVLDGEKYVDIGSLEDGAKVANLSYNEGQRLVVSYSPKRARKDRNDREEAIKKLRKKLEKSKNPESLVSNYGYKKYLKVEGNAEVKLNEDKLLDSAQWDGLHGVITNSKTLSEVEILQQYQGLWQIEEAFRVSKHDLKIRPIFHWTPARIRAHIAIAFMSLTCVKHLEYRVGLQHERCSAEKIRQELLHLQTSILKDTSNGEHYALPSSASTLGRKIYQVLGLKYSQVPYKLESTLGRKRKAPENL